MCEYGERLMCLKGGHLTDIGKDWVTNRAVNEWNSFGTPLIRLKFDSDSEVLVSIDLRPRPHCMYKERTLRERGVGGLRRKTNVEKNGEEMEEWERER